MTLDPTQVNSGADFIASDILPAAAVNSIDGNAELAWVSALSAMGPVTVLDPSGTLTIEPKIVGNTVNRVVSDSVFGYRHVTVASDGNFVDVAMSAALSNTSAIAFSRYSNLWYLFQSSSAVSNWYTSSGATMATMTSGDFGAGFGVNAAIEQTFGSNRILAVGVNATGYGVIYRLVASVPTLRHTSATARPFVDVAANSDGTGAVAVSDNATVAYSVDSGDTWTAVTLPSLPATATGLLSVSWSSLTGFLVSGLLTTGRVFWSTSSTGASWQAWRQTSQVAVSPTAVYVGERSCGMCAVGSVMVCPYVGAAAVGGKIVGALVSIDGGSSWRVVNGTGTAAYFDKLRAVPSGNRVAITASSWVTFSAQAVAAVSANSVLS